jgi:hypothetical protein
MICVISDFSTAFSVSKKGDVYLWSVAPKNGSLQKKGGYRQFHNRDIQVRHQI